MPLKIPCSIAVGNLPVSHCYGVEFSGNIGAIGPKFAKFPVFSLINRELGPETGSLETGSSASQSVSPANRAGDPANAPLSAARWLKDRTRDSQGLWCRAKKRG